MEAVCPGPTAHHVLMVLALLAHPGTGEIQVSVRRLAELTGRGRSVVREAVGRLVSAGHVRRSARAGEPNMLILKGHRPAVEPPPAGRSSPTGRPEPPHRPAGGVPSARADLSAQPVLFAGLPGTPPISPKGDICPPHDIFLDHWVVKRWNTIDGVVHVRKGSPKRSRLLDMTQKRYSRAEIEEALAAVAKSAFCMGDNDQGWRANIDWFLGGQVGKRDIITRLMEGAYQGKTKVTSMIKAPRGKYAHVK